MCDERDAGSEPARAPVHGGYTGPPLRGNSFTSPIAMADRDWQDAGRPHVCKPCRSSTARCTWLAAVKIARLSSLRTFRVGKVVGVILARLQRQVEVGAEKGSTTFGCGVLDGVRT